MGRTVLFGVLAAMAIVVAGCGGSSKGGPAPVEVLTSGVYSASETTRAVGDRLDADFVVTGQAVSGFARLRTGDLTFDSTSVVSGTAGRDAVITMRFPREGVYTLERQGISDRFLSRRVKGSTTTDGQLRLRKIAGTNHVTGNWTGTWVQGTTTTNMTLRFIRAGNLFQITGTTVRNGVAGRVTRGFGTIVGDRIELQMDFEYVSTGFRNTVRAEGQLVNNQLTVDTLTLRKVN